MTGAPLTRRGQRLISV